MHVYAIAMGRHALGTGSVVVYQIVGHDQPIVPDLRGVTWEEDFPRISAVAIHHVASGPLYVNGINWTVLPGGVTPQREKQLRTVTKASWRHFLAFHPDSHWYLRGFYDMYVNITNLLELVWSLEQNHDPMNAWVARYGCHYTRGIDYPHGSTGHLLSSYAVRQLVENVAVFDSCPRKQCEDVCLRFTMDRLGIPFYDGCSAQFVITFPRAFGTITHPPRCPTFQFYNNNSRIFIPPTPVLTAVTFHMHQLRMDRWKALILGAQNLSIVWILRKVDRIFFCTNAND
jgi:hypothetical protein